jgi:hypothetical protein
MVDDLVVQLITGDRNDIHRRFHIPLCGHLDGLKDVT